MLEAGGDRFGRTGELVLWEADVWGAFIRFCLQIGRL
jgi:hypothetical protein